MKAHHIAVMALEEYEPNPEFVGRNFNAGEIIQLVLKSRDGRWLPFRHVQMVMMHELAHCKEMNHSKSFWKVRDLYAKDLRGLWDKGYTGDGFWGRGKTVLSQEYENSERMPPPELEPKSLCGGTFRSKKKRKRNRMKKETLTYAERKQRRTLKKFGPGGETLGGDEEKRKQLEGGKAAKTKPRVGKSVRVRELRAAAALARLEQAKKDAAKEQDEEDSESSSEEDFHSSNDSLSEANNIDGIELLDSRGRSMVKVCESGDEQDEDIKRELKELQDIVPRYPRDSTLFMEQHNAAKSDPSPNRDTPRQKVQKLNSASTAPTRKVQALEKGLSSQLNMSTSDSVGITKTAADRECSVCSLQNEPDALVCAACGNVLDLRRLPNHWKCKSLACQGGEYTNPGDAGRCGLCGAIKPL
jgi:DNA-dependent metalloprotease WSS1